MEKEKEYLVVLPVLNSVLKYLAEKPYKEVAILVRALETSQEHINEQAKAPEFKVLNKNKNKKEAKGGKSR